MDRRCLLPVFCLLVLGVVAPPAHARDYAPLDRPGPALLVPEPTLKGALSCSVDLRTTTRTPVLLNPATGVTVAQNYSWNWEPALTALGIPWCAYDAPNRTLGDIQISAEYLVDAIRSMHAAAGRRIAIMGHSQGGMSMRWALRFWPDTRGMVDDVIGFSGSNHGTTLLAQCLGECVAASWQQSSNAAFIKALNSGTETFGGISYTNIWSETDEVVLPNGRTNASAALHTGEGAITNVSTQSLCPADVYEHLLVGTIDPVAYALAVDALTHEGPARPDRIDSEVCSQALMPGVDLTDPNTALQLVAAQAGLAAVVAPVNVVGVPTLTAEPPLRCYVFADCADALVAPPRCVARAKRVVRATKGLRKVRVTLDGKAVRTRRSGGRTVATVDLRRHRGDGPAVVRIAGTRTNGKRVVTTSRYTLCA